MVFVDVAVAPPLSIGLRRSMREITRSVLQMRRGIYLLQKSSSGCRAQLTADVHRFVAGVVSSADLRGALRRGSGLVYQ